jgi:transposase
MKRFIEGEERTQVTLLPECLDDYIAEDNPIRVVDVFVDELPLHELGFEGTEPAATGRPSYHPVVLLKIYIYGYLNRVQSSRRLEREAQRNVELMWLTGRLAPDFKTIADFRRDRGDAIRKVCREFVLLCRRLRLFTDGIVAIDGSKFKAVNNRDKNFTDRKLKARLEQLEDSIKRYLIELDRADRDARDAAQSTNRNELASSGLQPQASRQESRQDPWRRATDRGNEVLGRKPFKLECSLRRALGDALKVSSAGLGAFSHSLDP